MATKDDLLNLLDDAEAPAPVPVDPQAKTTRDDLIRMLDEGSAEILPPRPASGTHRGTGVVTRALEAPAPRRIADPAAAGATAFGLANPTAIDVPPPPEEVAAARAGVLYDKPAPAGHALASLAISDEEKLTAYRRALSQHYGQDVAVEIGPETGAIEYLDPDTGRFALASPPRTGMGKVTGAAGGTMVMVPELMGGAIAAMLTKSPTLVSLGGSAGALVGEIARLEMGRALGINQDMTPEAAARRALGVAGQSAAAGVAFDKAVQLAQFVRNAYKGDAVGFARLAERMGIDAEEAAAVQAQISDALSAERMRIGARNADLPPSLRRDLPEERRYAMTLGEASGNPEMLALQDEIKRSRDYQARFGEFDNERQRALVDFYDLLAEPFQRSPLTDSQTAARIKDMAETRLNYSQMRTNEHMARYQADANLALESVDSMPVYQFGDVARTVGAAEAEVFKNRANGLSNQIRTLAGNTRFIENTKLSETLDSLDTETRNIIFASLRNERRKEKMVPPKTIEGPEGEAILHPLYDAKSKWSFSQSWDTISDLKAMVREASEPGATQTRSVGALTKIIAAMEEDLYNAAGNTVVGPMYRNFIGWYRREKTRLEEGAVGRILQREGGRGGRFTLADGEVFREVFPDASARAGFGIRQTQEFMDLIKNDPQAVQAFRRAIADDWKRSTIDPETGRLNPVKHRDWLNRHAEQLNLKFPGLAPTERAIQKDGVEIVQPMSAGEPLFTLQERRALQRGAGLEEALQAREAARDLALERINNRFEAKLTGFDNMGQVLNVLRKDLDGNAAKDLVQMLNNPATLDVLRGVRSAYLKDMREKVMKAKMPATREPILNSRDLTTFLYGKSDQGERGQIAVLRQLFGPEYVNGLTTLEKALSATAREAPFPNRSGTAFWTVSKLATRIHFGVISKASLIITGAQRLQRTAADAIMARAIMNPADMKRLMGIWNTDIRTRKAAVVLGQFGFGPQDFGVEVEK